MYNSIRDFEKGTDKFYGMYRGIVTSRDDSKKSARLQIKVYPMFENVTPSDLPWAIPLDPLMGGSADTGSMFIPEVGAHMWVFFEAGDFRHPVYIGGAPAISGGTPDQPAEGRNGYPYNKVFKTKAGLLIELDDSPGGIRIHIKHPSGTDHLVDNEGSVTDLIIKDQTVTINGNSNLTIQGTHAITAIGNITITSSGVVTIVGSEVAIN